MPFYLDSENRCVNWTGSSHGEDAENALMAYRLSGGGPHGNGLVLYAEPEFGSRPYYNESLLKVSLMAAVEFLPPEAREKYEQFQETFEVRSISFLGLTFGEWGGRPIFYFNTPTRINPFDKASWDSGYYVVDRWPTTREEVRSKLSR